MALRRGGKRYREEAVEGMGGPVVFLSSSSDDEEANLDLSLEIVETARRRREEERNKQKTLELSGGGTPVPIDLSSSDEAEATSGSRNGGAGKAPTVEAAVAVDVSKKKKKKRKKKKQRKESGEEAALSGDPETADVAVIKNEEESMEITGSVVTETNEDISDNIVLRKLLADVAVIKNEEESMEITGSVVTETNEDISDNIVLRKLLRGPRYFDPGSSQWEICYNCGEEGHLAADCTAEKRKKPCFVCGMFGHIANKCSQGQDCFICKRRGHFAKDCPDKHRKTAQDNRICLRCGDLGHDMSSCGKSFHPDDLKKIQCYVCKGFGHFCCVDFIDTVPEEVSCYNCGDSGHSGAGCAKPRGESNGVASPKLCYICGEEGHFARGCTRKSKFCRRPSESSTLTPGSSKNRTAPRYSKNKKEFEGAKSLPRDFGMGSRSLPHCKVYNKKRSIQYERGINTTSRKSWGKGGWIVDDTGDLPKRNRELRPWKSPKNKPWKSPNTPRTPVQKSYRHYDSAGSSHRYHVY